MTWNLLTRVLHWAVAVPVLLNFFLDGEDDPHRIAGYVSLAAVALRVAWGCTTTDFAHFRHFPISASKTIYFLKNLLRGEKDDHQGHNPLASWVYIFMWILVAALGVTGYLMGTDQFWGEEWLGNLHSNTSLALEGLVIIHIIGLITDSIRFKRHTWRGMLDGKK